MKPFDLFLIFAIGVAIVASFVGVLTDCSQPQVLLLRGVVVDKAETVVQKEVTVIKPGCPSCPGAPPKEEIQVVDEVQCQVTVEAAEDGKVARWRIVVAAETYSSLQVGAAVEVRVVRGQRTGRECQPPELVLGPTS